MRWLSAALAVVLAATACTQSESAPPGRVADCARAGASDFDGDGRDDVAVGDPWTAGGAAYLLTAGRVVRLPSPKLGPRDGFGASLVMAKVNGDGCADLVIGAPYTRAGGVEAGAVHILYGGAAQPARRLTARKPVDGAAFGWSLAAYGDVIAIGAPREGAGAVHLARKGAIERTITQDTEGVPGNGDALDQFGSAVALGPMASGRTGLAIGTPYEQDDEGEVGAVTVVHDVAADKLKGTRLAPPGIDDGGLCEFGQNVAYVRGVGLAAGGADCGKVQFYGLDLRPSRTVKRPAATLRHEQVRLAASASGQVGALWPGPSPAIRLLGAKDTEVETKGIETARSLTFSGTSLVVGLHGAVAVVGQRPLKVSGQILARQVS